ncbi:hypothetical protein VDGL01_02257 [Verticillium dahliae]
MVSLGDIYGDEPPTSLPTATGLNYTPPRSAHVTNRSPPCVIKSYVASNATVLQGPDLRCILISSPSHSAVPSHR